jgi:hypothetical protein
LSQIRRFQYGDGKDVIEHFAEIQNKAQNIKKDALLRFNG